MTEFGGMCKKMSEFLCVNCLLYTQAWGNDEASAEFARHQIDACEAEGQSWSYWQYKFYNDPTTSGNDDEGLFFVSNGTVQDVKVRSLVRTYARRVQGLQKQKTKTAI